jgi:Tfp pilus assembly protein PilO
MIEARVDAADIAMYKRDMMQALAEFKTINRELRTIDSGEQEKSDNLNLVKN